MGPAADRPGEADRRWGRVVVFQRECQRGRSSGLELVDETASVVELRDGRVVRIQGYMDRTAALRAVGLSEKDVESSS
jgi:ketosteroid isomerase-like protein